MLRTLRSDEVGLKAGSDLFPTKGIVIGAAGTKEADKEGGALEIEEDEEACGHGKGLGRCIDDEGETEASRCKECTCLNVND